MSNNFCASRPSFSASRNASATTIIDAPRIMLLQIFGGNVWVIAMDLLMLGGYLWLALMAAREQPA